MGLLKVEPAFLLVGALLICAGFYFLIEKLRRGKSLDTEEGFFDINTDLKKIKRGAICLEGT